MNKSIMKTRNELQRITQKINQLKSKYSCQSLDQFSNDSYNRSVALAQSKNKKTVAEQSFKNILADSGVYNQQNINLASTEQNGFQAIYRKQFKLFRNELYQYLDHHLSRVKSRDNQIQSQLQEIYQQLQEKKFGGSQLVQDRNRIRKMQEKLNNLIAVTEQLSFHQKKQKKGESEIQKRFKRIYQRILEVQDNQKQEIQKMLPGLKNEVLCSIGKRLQQSQGKKQNIQKFTAQKLKVLQQSNEKVEKAIKKIQGQCQKLKNQVVELKVFNEKNNQLLQEAIRQTQHNKIQTFREIRHVEQRINQRQSLSNNCNTIINQFEQKLSQKETLITNAINTRVKAQLESVVQRTDEKYLILQQELKFTRQSLFQDIQIRFNASQKKLEKIRSQFENISGISNHEKPTSFNFQFNQEVYDQIKMMRCSYSKVNQQFEKMQAYSKLKYQQFQIKLAQLHKHKDPELENLKTYGKVLQKLVSKIEGLQQKQKQVEKTFVKGPQLCELLTIVQRVNLKMQETEQTNLKSQDQIKEQIKNILCSISKIQSNMSTCKVQSESQQREIIQARFNQMINQQTIKNDQKLSILNENIIQSAHQFKQYIEESEQCYHAIQSTIKILSDNLHQITDNQQNIDKNCRRMILKTQQKLIEKLEKQLKDKNPDTILQKRSQGEQIWITQKIQKLEKDINRLQIDVQRLDTENKTNLKQNKIVSEKEIQTFQIQLPNVKIFVDLIQQSINKMKKNIMEQISNEVVSVKQQQVNVIKQQLQQLNNKIEAFKTTSNNLTYLNVKNSQMGQKVQQIQKSMVEVISNLQLLLKQRNGISQPQRNIKIESTQSQKVLILQQQINFIKRTLIDGQTPQKQNVALKKVKKQFEQFKEKQNQQQSRLKNIVSNEVYKNMAGQFTKISQILERTFQQLQQKHAKLQYHLNCFNQRILALQSGQKATHQQERQSMQFSTVSEKHNFQSPSRIFSSMIANTIDINSRVSDDQNEIHK